VIVTIAVALAVGPALSIAHLAKAQPSSTTSLTSTYCQGFSKKGYNKNYIDGCTSGQADCNGGKPYNVGKGHTVDFGLGYQTGWKHAGCKSPFAK
jgi:hypothetical protein